VSTSDNSDFRIIADALKHFAKRLSVLKSDEDVDIGNGVIQKDLDANATKCTDLADSLMKEKKGHVITYNLGIICNSLIIYLSDLEASKKALFGKLSGGQQDLAGFETIYLDEEIKLVRGMKEYYCDKMKNK
jgi:hypothetical protein